MSLENVQPDLANHVFSFRIPAGDWQCPECKRASMPPSANAPVLIRQLSANGSSPATFVPPPDEDITRSVHALDYSQSDVDEIDGFKVCHYHILASDVFVLTSF
jgi:hypothetical protein